MSLNQKIILATSQCSQKICICEICFKEETNKKQFPSLSYRFDNFHNVLEIKKP